MRIWMNQYLTGSKPDVPAWRVRLVDRYTNGLGWLIFDVLYHIMSLPGMMKLINLIMGHAMRLRIKYRLMNVVADTEATEVTVK